MTTRSIPTGSDQYKRILKKLDSFITMSRTQHQDRCTVWAEAENSVLAYVPESAVDASRRRRRDRGEPTYTTISIPYTYAQVMAAHTYWSSVFFGRTPIHQFAGNHGEGEQQVMALEALINYQIMVGAAMGPYYIWLYDAAKYGCGIIGTYWDRRINQYTSVEKGEGGALTQITRQVLGYEGNCIYNVSPFDFIHDPRVPLGMFQKGEFVIVKRKLSWSEVVRRRAAGYFMNVDKLTTNHRPANPGHTSDSVLVRPENTDLADYDSSGKETKHPSVVYVYELYVDLLQKEWGLGGSSYPEKWCFTVTQDMEILLGVEPLGTINPDFPFDIAEPEVEAYASYSRGIPEVMSAIQNTMDWLINSHMFNVRATMNNQFIGDPSRIMMKDVNKSGEPGFFFRTRPEAYGQDVRTMLHQVPVQDVTRGHMADLEGMFGIGEKVLGINDQIMGALTGGGGRKTATEVRTSTGFGANRLKTCTEYISATGFGPHGQRLVQNSQQFYTTESKLRIVGDTATLAGPAFMDVTPDSIAGRYSFVHVDGTLPVDRLAQANLWKEILAGFRFLPQLMVEYDVSKLFAHAAQLAGLKNIHQMRVQIGSPRALEQAAMAGNMLKVGPGGAGGGGGGTVGVGPDSATSAGLNALGPERGAYG